MAQKTRWACPKCGRKFTRRNQWHSCGKFTLGTQVRGKSPEVVAIYRRFEAIARKCGPMSVSPAKTQVHFQAGSTFAGATLRRQWLDAAVILPRRLEHPRFRRILTVSPRSHARSLRIGTMKDLDEEVAGWLREAYRWAREKSVSR